MTQRVYVALAYFPRDAAAGIFRARTETGRVKKTCDARADLLLQDGVGRFFDHHIDDGVLHVFRAVGYVLGCFVDFALRVVLRDDDGSCHLLVFERRVQFVLRLVRLELYGIGVEMSLAAAGRRREELATRQLLDHLGPEVALALGGLHALV